MVLKKYPEADPEDVRLTLIALQLPPLERLNRSLRRGRVLPLSESEIAVLKSLTRHKVRFMVVGLSAAALQGAPVVTGDIDFWFEDLADPNLSAALVAVRAGYVPPFGLNPPMLAGQGTDPFDVVLRMDGLDSFAQEFKKGIPVRLKGVQVTVLPLERIVVSKRAARRPKDDRVLPVLENVLRTLEGGKAQPAKRKKRSQGQPAKRKRLL